VYAALSTLPVVRARSAARYGAHFSAPGTRALAQYFEKCTKPLFHKDFCKVINFIAASFQAAATGAGGAAAA
jgi:hypothetical protein